MKEKDIKEKIALVVVVDENKREKIAKGERAGVKGCNTKMRKRGRQKR